MLIDFRKDATNVPDLLINDQTVERVNEYKYLGTILDDKLNFGANTEAIHKKCQSRLYCLQKLRSLGVKKSVLCNFYKCFIESVVTFGFVCWFGGLSVKYKNIINKVVNVCGKITGEKQISLQQLYNQRVRRKAQGIINDTSHVLARFYESLPSGKRFRTMKVSTVRSRNSFIPTSIHLLNDS
jgi:hypothetical protein